MSPRQIIGCAIVFAAVILVQLPWDRISRKLRKIRTRSSEKKRRRPDCIFVRSAPLALAKCEIIPVLKPRDPVILGKRRRGDIKVLHILHPFNITPFVVAV